MMEHNGGRFFSAMLDSLHNQLHGDEPDVMSAFGPPSLYTCCFACGIFSDELSRVTMKCCHYTNSMKVTKHLCSACEGRINLFYESHGSTPATERDIWMFHLTHKRTQVPSTPEITVHSCCALCRLEGREFTVFTSRCCNESGALERKSILCLDCLVQQRLTFLNCAASMPKPDFSSYMFHQLTCTRR